MSRVMSGAALLCGLLLAAPGEADDTTVSLAWSAGVETSSGSYGGDVDIEDIYVPVTVTIEGRRVAFALTVPYLSVSAPVGTVDMGGVPVIGSGDIATESGLGDVIAGLTVFDVFYNRDLDLALDLTGKIKFGTADYEKGLGTGETDFTVIADLVRFLDRGTLIASAGYKFRGAPDDQELEDVALASLGGTLDLGARSRGGLFFDYREPAVAGEDAVTEVSAYFSRRLREKRSLQVFVYKGFGDSSPEWGAGFTFYAR